MFLNRDGVKLYYEVHGSGEPTLLFVHGWTMSHEVWREQVAVFSKTHRVVTIDLRGFGQSDKPEGDYTLELFADDVDFVIRGLKLEKPVYIGWSMGVSIGLVYAAAHPGSLSKLVLVDGTPMLIASGDFTDAVPPAMAQQLLGALQTDYAAGTQAFVGIVLPEPDTEALKAWVHGITLQTTPPIALNSIGNAGARDLRPLLSQIRTPTLIVYGDQDQLCLPAASRYMHAQIGGAEIHEFAGKGHAPFLTDRQAFNERLRSFISK